MALKLIHLTLRRQFGHILVNLYKAICQICRKKIWIVLMNKLNHLTFVVFILLKSGIFGRYVSWLKVTPWERTAFALLTASTPQAHVLKQKALTFHHNKNETNI